MLGVLTAFAGAAQEANINFETDAAWRDVVETAREQDKIIFVDCYTDWCGPCRHVAQTVFTVAEVAGFFNANFVNAKFEMEKSADGQMLMKTYDVNAYPTFLFIDPHTEELVYIKRGSGQGYEWLIDAGKQALDPALNKPGMERRYRDGDRDPELIMGYISLLGNLSQPVTQAAVTEEYLDVHAGAGLFTAETWEVLSRSVMDPLSKHFPAMIRGRQGFYAFADAETVDSYFANAIRTAAQKIVHHIWQPGAFAKLDDSEERHARLIETLGGIAEYPAAAMYLAFLEAADLARRHLWDDMLDKMEEVDAAGVLATDRDEYDYFHYNMIPLGRDGGNAEQRVRARAILDKKVKGADSYEYEHNYRQLSSQIEFLSQ